MLALVRRFIDLDGLCLPLATLGGVQRFRTWAQIRFVQRVSSRFSGVLSGIDDDAGRFAAAMALVDPGIVNAAPEIRLVESS